MLHIRAALTLFIATLFFCANVQSEEKLTAANFSAASEKQVFKQWKPYGFSLLGSRTLYQLMDDDGRQVMQAISDSSASGLIRQLPLRLQDYPVLNWHWKTESLPNKADDISKAGDDHSTRLYLIFNAPEPGVLGWIKNAAGWGDTHALNYIWANQSPVNHQLASPYTERSIMIAASSGEEKISQWVSITRNVYQDYINAFGTPPPLLSAIAIMTDGDNTDSRLISYYGDIFFQKAAEPRAE